MILNLLKIKDKLIASTSENTIKVEYNNLSLEIIYDNTKNLEQEKENLLKDKTKLENSISRREKLLSNVNYVNKAPQNIVEEERNSLKKEQEQLESIINKLNLL